MNVTFVRGGMALASMYNPIAKLYEIIANTVQIKVLYKINTLSISEEPAVETKKRDLTRSYDSDNRKMPKMFESTGYLLKAVSWSINTLVKRVYGA